MCGIVGTASTEGMSARSDRYSFMKIGIDIDSWRGWESTGIALVGKEAKAAPLVYKRAVNGRDFIQLKKVESLLNDIEKFPVVIGHNRAATTGRGNIVDDNAHPFQYGKITLVHNGHIRNCHDLKGASQGANCPVDSAQVAWAMDANGEMETLQACDGGFCFVWWNSENETLNIARNNERPMHMAYAEKENTLYFASELTQLLHLLKDVNIDEEMGIMFPKPWIWHQYNLKNLREYTKTPFAKRQGRQLTNTGNMKMAHGPTGKGTSSQPEILTAEELTDAALQEWANRQPSMDGTQDTTFEVDEIRKQISTQRRKDARLAGVPTSKKRQERAKQELGSMGLVWNSVKVCEPKTWVKYKNQTNLGSIVAIMRDGGHRVEIQNTKFQQFEEYYRIHRVLVDLVNVRNGPNNDKIVVGTVSSRMSAFLARRIQQVEENEKRVREEHRTSVSNSIDRVCPGPHGSKISIARFYELVANGCWHCESSIFPRECEEIIWINEMPICGICNQDPGIMELLGVPDHSRAGVH